MYSILVFTLYEILDFQTCCGNGTKHSHIQSWEMPGKGTWDQARRPESNPWGPKDLFTDLFPPCHMKSYLVSEGLWESFCKLFSDLHMLGGRISALPALTRVQGYNSAKTALDCTLDSFPKL